jgi:hypothetical protein
MWLVAVHVQLTAQHSLTVAYPSIAQHATCPAYVSSRQLCACCAAACCVLCAVLQDEGVAARVQALLSTPRFRCYRTTDVAGVELGGALKNVLAIACGEWRCLNRVLHEFSAILGELPVVMAT